MTANPLRLVSSAASGVGWHWLTSAVEMAALASTNWPMGLGAGPMGWTCSSRIATRTPGTDPQSVCAARRFTVATLQRWGAEQRCEDVAVVVSELLTNALRHGLPGCTQALPRWPIRLGLLQCGPCVLCAVADPSDAAPLQARPGELAETGRGLEVIGALSDRWGYTAARDLGKVVWATFSAEPGPDHPGADLWPGWLTAGQTLRQRASQNE
jgi:hypothetical protein